MKQSCSAVLLVAILAGGHSLAQRLPAETSAMALMKVAPATAAGDRAAMKRAIQDKGGFFPSLGNWFEKATPGWGFDIQAVGDSIFAVWFTYNEDGTPTWYIIVGQLAQKGNAMTLTGNIEAFEWEIASQTATATVVGTMDFTWSDETHADVAWTLKGESNTAEITFSNFASGIAYSDMTGHYYDPFLSPGWGYTLLTQGDVTVLTMYWYKMGQPVWAQGVLSEPRFHDAVFTLNYFFNPNLCPSCLGKRPKVTPKPPEDLVDVVVAYTGPLASTETAAGFVDAEAGQRAVLGDQLGDAPFGDINFLNSAESPSTAITAAALDSFDPTYTEFDKLVAQLGFGTCLEFEYDVGIFGAGLVGSFKSAYFKLEPTEDGGLPVYADAGCETPFNFHFNIDGISQIWATATGDPVNQGGALVKPIQASWGGNRHGFNTTFGECRRWDRLLTSGYTREEGKSLAIRLYGFARPQTDICPDGKRFPSMGDNHVDPPSGVDIANGVNDKVSIRGNYGQ